MTFKEKYTTESLKTAISTNPTSTPEQITAENKKIVVSDDSYLQAEMLELLIMKIHRAMMRFR